MTAGHWNFGGGAGKASERGRKTPAVEQQRRLSSWRWAWCHVEGRQPWTSILPDHLLFTVKEEAGPPVVHGLRGSRRLGPHHPFKDSTVGLPWPSSGSDSAPPLQGAQVRSLVRELRSHVPCDVAKNKKKKERKKAKTVLSPASVPGTLLLGPGCWIKPLSSLKKDILQFQGDGGDHSRYSTASVRVC